MLLNLKEEEDEEGLTEGLVIGDSRNVLYIATVLFFVSKIECVENRVYFLNSVIRLR